MTRFEAGVYKDWLDTSETPEIRLRGEYLSRFGFTVGTDLMITVEHGSITITVIPDTEDRQDS